MPERGKMGSSLCSTLVQEGLLRVEALKELLALQVIKGGQIDTILLEKNLLSEADLSSLLSRVTGYPALSPELIQNVQEEAARTIRSEVADRLGLCPIRSSHESLLILVGENVDQVALEELAFELNQPISPFVAPELRIIQARHKIYGIPIPARYLVLLQRFGDVPDLPSLDNLEELAVKHVLKPSLSSRRSIPSQEFQVETGEFHWTSPPSPEEKATDETQPSQGEAITEAEKVQEAAPPTEQEQPSLTVKEAEKVQEAAPPTEQEQPSLTVKEMEKLYTEIPPMPPDAEEGEETMAEEEEAGSIAAEPTPSPSVIVESVIEGVQPDSTPVSPVPESSSPAPVEPVSGAGAMSSIKPPIISYTKPTMASSPLAFEDAVAAMRKAPNREELLLALTRGVHHYLESVQTYVVKQERLEGQIELTLGHLDRDRIRNRKLALAVPSIISRAVKNNSLYVGPPPNTDASETVLLSAGISVRTELALIPICLKQKTICLLMGHNFAKHIQPMLRTPLTHLAEEAANAFAGLIVLRKKDQPERRQPTRHPTPGAKAIHVPMSRNEEISEALEIMTPAVTPIGRLSKTKPSSPSGPPPKEPAVVPHTGFPFDTVRPLDVAVIGQKGLDTGHQGIEMESPYPGVQATNVFTAQPTLPLSTAEENWTANSLQTVLDKLESNDPELAWQAHAELKRLGTGAIRTLITWFPGQLHFNPHDHYGPLPPLEECSTVLKALVIIGRPVVFAIAPLYNHKDSNTRFFATYLLSELFFPESVALLALRLQDPEPQIRRIASQILQSYKSREEFPEVLYDLRADLAHPEARPRKAAAEALAALADVESIPALVAMMNDPEFAVAESACNALVNLTKQDFARNEDKWLTWWEQNYHRHRIEWLIDALTHKAPEIRTAAISELLENTGLTFGYRFDMDPQEREEIQRHFLEWWATEGRARFGT